MPTKCSTIRAAGQPVGTVAGDVFIKRIRGSVHMLKRPPALCLDVASLADAERAGARRVEITDTETGRTYRAGIATCRRYGRLLDRGYGEQLAIPLGRWACEDLTSPYRQLAFDWGAAR